MKTPIESALSHVPAAFERLFEDLGALVAIPSVSGVEAHAEDCRRAAAWIKARLAELPGAAVQIFETVKNPIVYARVASAQAEAPTLLIYAHYDVQTAEPLDDWAHNPFEAQREGDLLFGRGTSDMKGPFLATVAALEAIAASGPIPINILYLVEGDEESDPEPLRGFLEEHGDLLECDACLNVDAGMLGPDLPTIVYGLRGSSNCTVRVFGPSHDLHDGMYGGVVENPIHVLARVIAGLQDDRGRIAIPGFYERVRPIERDEHQAFSRHPHDEAFFLAASGAPALRAEEGLLPVERVGARPSMNVRWFEGGAKKNAIPSQAAARISFRLVPDQDPAEIHELFLEHLREVMPPTVTWTTEKFIGSRGALVRRDSAAVRALAEALRAVWDREPIFDRIGGGIPVVGMLQEALGVDSVLTGFSLPEDNIHGPDEHVHLPTLRRGLEALVRFFLAYAKEG